MASVSRLTKSMCVCLSLEEDPTEHVFGCVNGRPPPTVPSVATSHAPTG